MAVTILERPEGHILSTTENTATVSESYGAGDAQFVSPTVHGLTDGDYIYAESDIEDYAGFWYVDVLTTGIFKIKPYQNGDYVQFIANGSITWYASTLTHGWSAVHLPITYRLSTDLYPTNGSDTSRNITSVTDSNGYSVIHLSGSLGSGVNSYDFVKITVPSDTELSGVYQILEFISPTVMIINLAYDSGNNFTSATALKHYNNYNIIVRIYAGINSSHEWTAQKPYEIAATLPLIPDDNNEVFFSVNENIKSYIETRNNLALGTLPNNIDFWSNFYIEFAESYDDSDGYVFGTFTSAYTSDQSNFEGTAVNVDLEFKNLQSGYLSEYLMTNNAAKFLTLFTIPVLFACADNTPDCYSDISFLNPYNDVDLSLKKQYYLNSILQTTETDALGRFDSGVIRQEIEPNCNYDRVDLSLLLSPDEDSFSNVDDPINNGTVWINKVNTITDLNGTSDFYVTPYNFISGQVYTVDFNITIAITGPIDTDVFVMLSNTDTPIYPAQGGDTEYYNTSGVKTGTFSLTATSTGVGYIVMQQAVNASGGASSLTLTINSLIITPVNISETKQFKIDCGCAKQELRLTWLNNLGGFDNWVFTGKKDDIIEIQEALETKKNIFPQWPKSYGSTADTIRKQTLRTSNKAYTVRSQHLTADEADAISYLRSSVLVQIINSRTNRRTVIVDSDSFLVRNDGDKTFEAIFNISFTDDIPAQTT